MTCYRVSGAASSRRGSSSIGSVESSQRWNVPRCWAQLGSGTSPPLATAQGQGVRNVWAGSTGTCCCSSHLEPGHGVRTEAAHGRAGQEQVLLAPRARPQQRQHGGRGRGRDGRQGGEGQEPAHSRESRRGLPMLHLHGKAAQRAPLSALVCRVRFK